MNAWGATNAPVPVITLGTCSLCGGAVQIPQVYTVTGLGGAPIPTCSSCGAKAADAHGPIIQMVGGKRT